MVNPGLDEIKRSNFQYDFDYEHKIAREYGIDDSHDSENPSAHNSSASFRDLPSLQVRSPMAAGRCRSSEGFCTVSTSLHTMPCYSTHHVRSALLPKRRSAGSVVALYVLSALFMHLQLLLLSPDWQMKKTATLSSSINRTQQAKGSCVTYR